MSDSILCIPDIWIQSPAAQNNLERALANKFKTPAELFGLNDSEGFTLKSSDDEYLKVRG